MKFYIQSKSGSFIQKDFPNYKEAQKYADAHFGKGSIVQVVGNRGIVARAVLNSIADNATRRDVPDDVTAAKQVHLKIDDFTYRGKGEESLTTTLAKLKGYLSLFGAPGAFMDVARKLNTEGYAEVEIAPRLKIKMTAKWM